MNLVAELRLCANAAFTQREAMERLIFCAEAITKVTFGTNPQVLQLRDAIEHARAVLKDA